ncbi:MAG: peptidylprolyl isomerase [Thermoanaerobaculia bacterium]|nr:peptidylprolyl isomerase [Thermoanaerobaculia bacterium]
MKTLIGTTLLMIVAIGGLWTYASAHADSTDYVFDEKALHEKRSHAAPSRGEVVVRVNGEPITSAQFDLALASFPENARGVMFSEAGRKVIAEELIRLELLAQKAERENLDERDDVRAQLEQSVVERELVRKNILAQAALRELVEQQQKERGTLRELYQRVREDFETAEVRQLIVSYRGSRLEREDVTRTKEEARKLAREAAEKLRSGAPFETVLREYGDNPENWQLGPLRRDSTPPDFAEAIFSLDGGETSDPVETQWGFHVFQMASRTTPSFEEIEEQLGRQARQLWTRVAVEDLREEAEVEFDEEFFGEMNDEG